MRRLCAVWARGSRAGEALPGPPAPCGLRLRGAVFPRRGAGAADQVPWVVCGVARLEDLGDIDVIETMASIDAELVRMTELVPLNASTTQQLERELADALGVLDGLESAYEEQRERVEELRREEREDDE